MLFNFILLLNPFRSQQNVTYRRNTRASDENERGYFPIETVKQVRQLRT